MELSHLVNHALNDPGITLQASNGCIVTAQKNKKRFIYNGIAGFMWVTVTCIVLSCSSHHLHLGNDATLQAPKYTLHCRLIMMWIQCDTSLISSFSS